MTAAAQEPSPPAGVDLENPSIARIYDFLLGGTANWAIDREFGKRLLTVVPLLRPIAKANRLFLHRAVRYLIRQGVEQFIDIGSGVPTMGNTHEVADELAPESRVVYIDNEPVAVAHSQVLLDQYGDPKRHAVISADLRRPDELWRGVESTGVIDFRKPVALLMIAVLHIQQEGPDGTDWGESYVARYRELLRPGSYLALSHVTDEGVPAAMDNDLVDLKALYDSGSSSKVIWRSRTAIESMFGDFQMCDPGLTWTPLWHPEETSSIAPVISFETPNESVILAGVGRKP